MNLMTVQEVTETLRVSQMTVRRYIQSGKLAAVRVGRGVRVDRSAVDRFVEPVVPCAELTGEDDDAGILTFDDPLWTIVGIMKDGPPDLAANHDKYLAEAYEDLHRE